MSSERHTRNEQFPNSIPREPTRREITSIQIASRALAIIRDNVRRLLVNENSSDESQTSVPANVVTECEYPYDANDYSLITSNNEMAYTPERAPENLIYSEIDKEIQPLRNSLPRNDEAGSSRRITYDGDQRENVLMREFLQEIRELRLQLLGPSGNEHVNRDGRRRETLEHSNHPLGLTYGRTHEDVRNQPGHLFGFLILKEARNMIPEFDGNSRNCVREFLNAASYAMKNIHPADKQTLLEAILCTKFKGKAMVDFHTRDVCSYEQLKHELEAEYLSKRSPPTIRVQRAQAESWRKRARFRASRRRVGYGIV